MTYARSVQGKICFFKEITFNLTEQILLHHLPEKHSSPDFMKRNSLSRWY